MITQISAKGGSASSGKYRLYRLFIIGTVFFFMGSAYAEEAEKFVYDSHGKRDPFIPLVGLPHSRSMSRLEIVSIDDVDFQGIARDAKGKKIIIINGEMLREGAKLDALTVKKITDKEAIVEIRGKEYNLNFYVKEGEKSD